MHASNAIHVRLLQVLIPYIYLLPQGVLQHAYSTTKITLKSGFIGVATHKSIIDFIYYSYILNPVFVRLVLYRKPDKDVLFYAPLTFAEALSCALNYRGFDPIIVHNYSEFKNVKHRKLAMKTLVSECF